MINRFFPIIRLSLIAMFLTVSLFLGACDMDGTEEDNGVGIEEGIGSGNDEEENSDD